MISQNASLRLPWLTQAFGGSRVNSGLFLAIIALIFVWLLMKKTTLGFEASNPKVVFFINSQTKISAMIAKNKPEFTREPPKACVNQGNRNDAF